jgi:hypothetical protein
MKSTTAFPKLSTEFGTGSWDEMIIYLLLVIWAVTVITNRKRSVRLIYKYRLGPSAREQSPVEQMLGEWIAVVVALGLAVGAPYMAFMDLQQGKGVLDEWFYQAPFLATCFLSMNYPFAKEKLAECKEVGSPEWRRKSFFATAYLVLGIGLLVVSVPVALWRMVSYVMSYL